MSISCTVQVFRKYIKFNSLTTPPIESSIYLCLLYRNVIFKKQGWVGGAWIDVGPCEMFKIGNVVREHVQMGRDVHRRSKCMQ